MIQNSLLKKATYFYAPIWIGDFKKFVLALKGDQRYVSLEKNNPPMYLLPYAADIYKDDSLFFGFELKKEFLPKLCMYSERLNLKNDPELISVKIYAFDTGCAFAEFYVGYGDLPTEQIVDFSFRFKNATRTDSSNGYSLTMLDALNDLLSSYPSAKIFFTAFGNKRECRMFHHIFDKDNLSESDIQKHIRHLARGYHKNFLIPENDGDYDMIYRPYSHDYWAGSQEGLINYYHLSGDDSTDSFSEQYKYDHIANNYAFMYLMLLNQRFGAIQLISEITKYENCTKSEKMALNKKIVQLKTTFSFKIVSDDQLYQNVYNRMYDLLDIDRLLDDIRDNEQQAEIIRNCEALEQEKLTSYILLGLSVLSVFSVLIDASSYFDRIPYINEMSTALSFVCLVIIVSLCVGKWLKYKKE